MFYFINLFIFPFDIILRLTNVFPSECVVYTSKYMYIENVCVSMHCTFKQLAINDMYVDGAGCGQLYVHKMWVR